MRPAHILLVEDNETDVFLLRQAFDEHQVHNELQVIGDGGLAFALFSKVDTELPDLVILDINLPKVDGLTLLALIRKSSRYNDTPVLMLTSSQAVEDRTRALQTGADAFLHKAGSLDDFLALGGVIKGYLGPQGRKVRSSVARKHHTD